MEGIEPTKPPRWQRGALPLSYIHTNGDDADGPRAGIRTRVSTVEACACLAIRGFAAAERHRDGTSMRNRTPLTGFGNRGPATGPST